MGFKMVINKDKTMSFKTNPRVNPIKQMLSQKEK